MKAVILAGGLGTRLSEETHSIPKPMVEIGQRPILWHIMKCYSFHGINEFIICCGYKGNVIKEYFASYGTYNSDITVDLHSNSIEVHEKTSESWKITLIDTGQETMTGGRLKRVSKFIEEDEAFCFTYGDGLSDINISQLIEAHKDQGLLATLTAVYPPGRFGALKINDGIVTSFQEKPKGDNSRINGGFFVLSPKVLDYIADDSTVWEQEPLEKLAKDHQIHAFLHDGFWQAMDTLRDKIILQELWNSNQAKWKKWN
jgi:glucose-1-phosphate cytidylyltransferase|tara:strand:+ start:423 stop:1196 length:774 start_codon:yes stop_codon:yes gene_type:complete